jgi:GNAT superfamily N-acetyltransferase
LSHTFTHAEVLEEVVVAPRGALVPLPDLRIIERPGWLQIVTPSYRTGGFNEVSFAVIDDGEADAVIDETIAGYRRLGIAFRWLVVPGSKPDDLAERLERRGLVRGMVRGMARPTADPLGGLEGDFTGEVQVEEVDESTVDLFTRVMAEGWDSDAGELASVNARLLGQPDRIHRMFMATHRGEPAAVATYCAFPRSAYLLGGVVLPRFRGKGLYRALVDARLLDAAARGIRLATAQARESTSAPILERMGFGTVCRFPIFRG